MTSLEELLARLARSVKLIADETENIRDQVAGLRDDTDADHRRLIKEVDIVSDTVAKLKRQLDEALGETEKQGKELGELAKDIKEITDQHDLQDIHDTVNHKTLPEKRSGSVPPPEAGKLAAVIYQWRKMGNGGRWLFLGLLFLLLSVATHPLHNKYAKFIGEMVASSTEEKRP